MADLTLQDLLDSGISLEEILFNKDPVEVSVNVDVDNLVQLLSKSQTDQRELIKGIKDTITKNNKDNKEFLVKALSFLIKEERTKDLKPNQITGIKVKRDSEGRLDEFHFIREE